MAAGTLFGIGLSQQNDVNGKPMAGCLLYLYLANTQTKVTPYRNVGLTPGQELPNPIPADGNGRIPAFWLDAAFNYHATLVSAQGIVQFDEQNIMPIGAVTGSGTGTGDTTDVNSTLNTGDIKWRPTNEVLPGWVRMNGKTIGNASSGATETNGAGLQAQPLFEYIWRTFDNTFCPLLTSAGAPIARGSSGPNDFNLNRQITLLDMRGRAPFGLDGMGNALINRLTVAGADLILGGNDFPATVGGHEGNTLGLTQVPAHQHDAFIDDPAHFHTITVVGGTSPNVGGSGPGTFAPDAAAAKDTNTKTTGVRVKSASVPQGTGIDDKTSSVGGGQSHFNMPPYMLGTWFWRL